MIKTYGQFHESHEYKIKTTLTYYEYFLMLSKNYKKTFQELN